jgi:5-methylthioadenosine/S-adenosylhomocysteine deaminase
MTPIKIDLLINCQWIIPIVPENKILHNCGLAVDKDRGLGILPQVDANKRFSARTAEHLTTYSYAWLGQQPRSCRNELVTGLCG